MIQLIIFDQNKISIFNRIFVKSLTDFQFHSINNSITSILRVNQKFGDDILEYFSSFSLAGVGINILIKNFYSVVFITPLDNNKTLCKNFEDKVISLVTKAQFLDPKRSLELSQYFQDHLTLLLAEFEKKITLKQQRMKELNFWQKTASVMGLSNDISNEKYLIIGDASAGKSSIIAQFFKNWSQDQITQIRPTIWQNIQNYKESYINRPFYIFDLGGQLAFQKRHLNNSKLFSNVRAIIFIVDLYNQKNIQIVQNYFLEILKQLKIQNQFPPIFVFLHKFDPHLRKSLQTQIHYWINWINNLNHTKLYQKFFINFDLTSIKDNTAREALSRAFLLTLPQYIIEQSFNRKLITKASEHIYETVKTLEDSLNSVSTKLLGAELYRNSIPIGLELGKLIIQDWIEYLTNSLSPNNIETLNLADKNKSVTVNQFNHERKIKICFKCPLKEEIKNVPQVCQITFGLFEGLRRLMGFKEIEVENTQIINNSNECNFNISY